MTIIPTTTKEWVRIKELAALLGFSPRTMQKIVNSGQASGRVGRLAERYHLETVRAYARELSLQGELK